MKKVIISILKWFSILPISIIFGLISFTVFILAMSLVMWPWQWLNWNLALGLIISLPVGLIGMFGSLFIMAYYGERLQIKLFKKIVLNLLPKGGE